MANGCDYDYERGRYDRDYYDEPSRLGRRIGALRLMKMCPAIRNTGDAGAVPRASGCEGGCTHVQHAFTVRGALQAAGTAPAAGVHVSQ